MHQVSSSGSSREISPSCSPGNNSIIMNNSSSCLNPPRFGTTVPNRIFVGGITTDTSECDLEALFARFGTVSAVKIINDRAGVPRGYGFITFETEEEAKRVLREGDNLVLKGRKLNVAIAIKKQQVGRIDSSHQYSMPNGTLMFPGGLAAASFAPSPFDHFYSPEVAAAAAAAAAMYPFHGHHHHHAAQHQHLASGSSHLHHAAHGTAGHAPPPPPYLFYQPPQPQPFTFIAHNPSSHATVPFSAPGNHPASAAGSLPQAASAPAHAWGPYILPPVLTVNNHSMNHVS